MRYGMRSINKGCEGRDVQELQIRLSGFVGGVPDGDFGPGTERQVMAFQRDVMAQSQPSGVADMETLEALESFAAQHPMNWQDLACPCGVCRGFGQGLAQGEYRAEQPHIEAYHQYEYAGIHRSLLWALRAIIHYHPQLDLTISSGYRCSVNNRQKGRTSTNHHGKAIDIATHGSREQRMMQSDRLRDDIMHQCNAQLGWQHGNKKSLEPANIAPTWVHLDVRCFAPKFLGDEHFCRNPVELDRPL
ncbi:MAG: peptidoglycan-binding protein [Mariprofundaceae bacterium]|nr:peptidoglycan-binding protein [Mariprofundaceae bacterium]